jgi:hypothetical protein
MNLKCLIGFHKWAKLGGPQNYGGGKFAQSYVCMVCRKTKKAVG